MRRPCVNVFGYAPVLGLGAGCGSDEFLEGWLLECVRVCFVLECVCLCVCSAFVGNSASSQLLAAVDGETRTTLCIQNTRKITHKSRTHLRTATTRKKKLCNELWVGVVFLCVALYPSTPHTLTHIMHKHAPVQIYTL